MNARAGCLGAAGWRSRPNSRLGPRHRLPRVFPLGVVMFPISLQPVQVMHNNSRALGVAPGHSPPCSPLTFSRNPARCFRIWICGGTIILWFLVTHYLGSACDRMHPRDRVCRVWPLWQASRGTNQSGRGADRRQVPRPRGFHVIRRIRTGSTRIHNHMKRARDLGRDVVVLVRLHSLLNCLELRITWEW